jgi:hypothetical protein
LTGAAFVFGPQLLYPLIANSAGFERVVALLGGIAHYR